MNRPHLTLALVLCCILTTILAVTTQPTITATARRTWVEVDPLTGNEITHTDQAPPYFYQSFNDTWGNQVIMDLEFDFPFAMVLSNLTVSLNFAPKTAQPCLLSDGSLLATLTPSAALPSTSTLVFPPGTSFPMKKTCSIQLVILTHSFLTAFTGSTFGNALSWGKKYSFQIKQGTSANTLSNLYWYSPAALPSWSPAFSVHWLGACWGVPLCALQFSFTAKPMGMYKLYSTLFPKHSTITLDCINTAGSPIYIITGNTMVATQQQIDSPEDTCTVSVPLAGKNYGLSSFFGYGTVYGNTSAIVGMADLRQPIISPTKPIVPHYTACVINQRCSFTFEFDLHFVRNYPLIEFLTPAPAIYVLRNSDYCQMLQTGSNIMLQVVRNTMLGPDDKIWCTLEFTPTELPIKNVTRSLTHSWDAEEEDWIFENYAQRPDTAHDLDLISLSIKQIDPSKVSNITDYLAQVTASAQAVDMTLYQPHIEFNDDLVKIRPYFVPFSRFFSPRSPLITVSLLAPNCSGVITCPLLYSFHTSARISRIRMSNFLRYTNANIKLPCTDLTGTVIGYVTVDSFLEYLYLDAVDPQGFDFGTCQVDYIAIATTTDGYVSHEYELSMDSYLPHTGVHSLYSLGTQKVTPLQEKVWYPKIIPHTTQPLNFFIQPNSMNNLVTFLVSTNPAGVTLSTVKTELIFASSQNPDAVFDFSQVSCYLPNFKPEIIAPSCSAYATARSLVLDFDRLSDTTNTAFTQVTFTCGAMVPDLLMGVILDYQFNDPITNERVSGQTVQNNINYPLPVWKEPRIAIYSPLQLTGGVAPKTVVEHQKYDIALFTGHVTPVHIDFSPGKLFRQFVDYPLGGDARGLFAGSIIILQLNAKSQTSPTLQALRWELENMDEVTAPLTGLRLYDMGPTCSYCVAFEVLPSPTGYHPGTLTGGTNPLWSFTHLENIILQVKYLDTYASFGTMDTVKLDFKLIISFQALKYQLLTSAPKDQYNNNVYQMPFSPRFITYNYQITKKMFLRDGLTVSAAIAGNDPKLSTSLERRQPITLIMQPSNILVADNITFSDVYYAYKFKNCSPWVLVSHSDECMVTHDTLADISTIKCGLNGSLVTSFKFYPPSVSTAILRCSFTTQVTAFYKTAPLVSHLFVFEKELTFIPAVLPSNIIFNRDALICGTQDHPVFYVGGPGTYTISFPVSEGFTSQANSGLGYSITAYSPITRQIILRVEEPRVRTTVSSVTAVYFTLNCPAVVSNVHQTIWSIRINDNNSVVQLSPRNGFFVYVKPEEISSKLFLSMKRNKDGEIITDPTHLQQIDTLLYLYASYPAGYPIQLFPPQRQLLLGVASSDEWVSYDYLTHGYNENGTPGLIKKSVPVQVAALSTDVTRIQMTFMGDVELFDFNTPGSFGSDLSYDPAEFTTTTDPNYMRYGCSFKVLPFSRYNGDVHVAQCHSGNCKTSFLRRLVILPPPSLTMDFNPEFSYPSYFSVSRDISIGDVFTLLISSNNASVPFNLCKVTQEYINGYSVDVYDNDDGLSVISLSFHQFFPAFFNFELPTTVSDLERVYADETFSTIITLSPTFIYSSQDSGMGENQHIELELDDVKYTITKSTIFKPILQFSFPNGFLFGTNVVFRFILGRALKFGQSLQIYPLPIIPNVKVLLKSTAYELELVSTPHETSDPFKSTITLTSRTTANLPPGTTIEFSFPAIEPQTSSHSIDADVNPIYFSSPGFDSSVLFPYSVMTSGSVIELLNPVYPLIHHESNFATDLTQKPCIANTLCKFFLYLSVDETETVHGYPLSQLPHFDVVLDFQIPFVMNGTNTAIHLNPTPPLAYQNATPEINPENQYQYTYTYTATTITIHVDSTVSIPSPSSILQAIPFYLEFTTSQDHGSTRISICRRSSSNLTQNTLLVYKKNYLQFPIIKSDDEFNPYFFYINGGLFVGEEFTIGFAPSTTLTPKELYDPSSPQPKTILADFTLDPASAGRNDFEWGYSTIESVLDHKYQMIPQLDTSLLQINSKMYMESTKTTSGISHYRALFAAQSLTTHNELFHLRSTIPVIVTQPIDMSASFNVTLLSQPFDETLAKSLPPDPVTASVLTPQFTNEMHISQNNIPGFTFKPKPWIRVQTSPSVIPIDQNDVAITLFISIDLPSHNVAAETTTTSQKYAFKSDDRVYFTLPPYYSLKISSYTCLYQCVDSPSSYCTSYLEFDGTKLHLRFNQTLPTTASEYLCEIKVSVLSEDFYGTLQNEGKRVPYPDFTRTIIDYHTTTPSYLDISSDPSIPIHLPTRTSYELYQPTDIAPIRDLYLTMFMPMPVTLPRYHIDVVDMYTTGTPGKLRFRFYNSTVSSKLSSTILVSLPFQTKVTSGEACIDESTETRVGTLRTYCPISGTECNDVQLIVENTPALGQFFTCLVQELTPTSTLAHFFVDQDIKLAISSTTDQNVKPSTSMTTGQLSFISTYQTLEYRHLTIQAPKPSIILRGTLISGLNAQLHVLGTHTTIYGGDSLKISLGGSFKSAHFDPSNVHCITPSNIPLATVSWVFEGQREASLEPQTGSVTENGAKGIAVSFVLTFVNTTQITQEEPWQCHFDINPVTPVKQIQREPSAYLKTTVTNVTSVLAVVNSMRHDQLLSIDLGMKYNSSVAQRQSFFQLYFNITQLELNPTVAPIGLIYLPSTLLSLPDNLGIECRLGNTNIAPQQLTFTQLNSNSLDSIYMMPLDRFIFQGWLDITDMQHVRCTIPHLSMHTQNSLTEAKFVFGASVPAFSDVSFQIPNVIGFTISHTDFLTSTVREYIPIDDHFPDHPRITVYNNIPATFVYNMANIDVLEQLTVEPGAPFTLDVSPYCINTDGEAVMMGSSGSQLVVMLSGTRQCSHQITASTLQNLKTNIYPFTPLGCGTTVGKYCITSSHLTYNLPGVVYKMWALDILHKPFVQVTSSPIPISTTNSLMYEVQFSGYYPGATILFKIDSSVIHLSDVTLVLSQLGTTTVSASCPATSIVDGGDEYRCEITATTAPFWLITRAIFTFTIAKLDASLTAIDRDPQLFTVDFTQTPILQTLDDVYTLKYTIPSAALQNFEYPFLSWLQTQGNVFENFLTQVNKPTFTIIYPASYDPVIEENQAIPSGLVLKYTAVFTNLPLVFSSISLPFASFAMDTTQSVSASSIFSTPEEIHYTWKGRIFFEDHVSSLCIDPEWDPAKPLFTLSLSSQTTKPDFLASRREMVDITANFLPNLNNIEEYYITQRTTTLSCNFPLSFLRTESPLDLPRFDLPQNGYVASIPVSNIVTMVHYHGSISYTAPYTNSITDMNGIIIHTTFSQHYSRKEETTIILNDDVMFLGRTGLINIEINRPTVQQYDVLLIKFTPEISTGINLNTIEYKGDGDFTDLFFTTASNYDALTQQQYRFSAPPSATGPAPCYSTWFYVPGSPQVKVGELSAANSLFQNAGGASGDFFLLNITNPLKYQHSSLFNQLSCYAPMVSTAKHPFSGKITASYIDQLSYKRLTIPETFSPQYQAGIDQIGARIRHELQTEIVGQIHSSIKPGFDIRVVISSVAKPLSPVSLILTLSSTPEQFNIFVVVDLTKLLFGAFYGCDGDYTLADYYTPENGALNQIHQYKLRVFAKSVDETTRTISCHFMSSQYTPDEYLIKRENDSAVHHPTGILNFTTNPEIRPFFPVKVSAYKLLSPSTILSSPYINPFTYGALSPYFAPTTIEQMDTVRWFELFPIATHTAQAQTVYYPSEFTSALTLRVLRNENEPYLTPFEQTSLKLAFLNLINVHLLRGLFIEFSSSQIFIIDQRAYPQHGFVAIIVAFINTDADLSRLAGMDAGTIEDWTVLLQNESGLLFHSDTWANSRFPQIQTSTNDNNHVKAIYLNELLSLLPFYPDCLLRTGGNCQPGMIGDSCYIGQDCQSGYCEVALDHGDRVNPRSPRAVKAGVTSSIGFCRNVGIIAPTARKIYQDMINSHTALKRIKSTASILTNSARQTTETSYYQQFTRRSDLIRYLGYAKNEHEYARYLFANAMVIQSYINETMPEMIYRDKQEDECYIAERYNLTSSYNISSSHKYNNNIPQFCFSHSSFSAAHLYSDVIFSITLALCVVFAIM